MPAHAYFPVYCDAFFELGRKQQELFVHILARMNNSGNYYEKYGVSVKENQCVTTKADLMKAIGMDIRDDKE